MGCKGDIILTDYMMRHLSYSNLVEFWVLQKYFDSMVSNAQDDVKTGHVYVGRELSRGLRRRIRKEWDCGHLT
jgi:hypothetical protein